ncbi:MAG TPA: universal stress protein [Gemmatimonadaceae bacterium]
MRIRRAVIGIDFGAPSIAAARWAVHHFIPEEDAELLLMHVLPVGEPAPETGADAAAMAAARARALEQLRALRATLGVARIRVAVRMGEPAVELAEAAYRSRADLLVVGKRSVRHGPWSRLGDTADRLAFVTSVPVLLVTGPRDVRPRRLLVALDGAADPSLLRWTSHLAERFAARVTAIHVERTPARRIQRSFAAIAAHAHEPAGEDAAIAPWQEEGRWLGMLAAAGIDVGKTSVELRQGDPARQILAEAERERSELIVIGHHGEAHLRHAVLGSVARAVLRGAKCPVLLVTDPLDEIVESDERTNVAAAGPRE